MTMEHEAPPVAQEVGKKEAVRPEGVAEEKEIESVLAPGQRFFAVARKPAWFPSELPPRKLTLVVLAERATQGGGV
jgi:hypothetical protein